MPFHPQVGDQLNIDGVIYRIAEHPAAPGMPYGQAGRRAIVYALTSPSAPSLRGRCSWQRCCAGVMSECEKRRGESNISPRGRCNRTRNATGC